MLPPGDKIDEQSPISAVAERCLRQMKRDERRAAVDDAIVDAVFSNVASGFCATHVV